MSSKIYTDKSGFSLVELMVVVAIIGIIATVAVPNFLKFQAKAKQTNAKSELSSIYTTEKIFYLEYGSYHTSLSYLGFVPDSIPLDSNNCPIGYKADWSKRYYYSEFIPTLGGVEETTLFGGIPLSCGNNYTCYSANSADVDLDCEDILEKDNEPLNTVATFSAQTHSFNAGAVGIINGSYDAYSVTSTDIWQIDENKQLTNLQSGL